MARVPTHPLGKPNPHRQPLRNPHNEKTPQVMGDKSGFQGGIEHARPSRPKGATSLREAPSSRPIWQQNHPEMNWNAGMLRVGDPNKTFGDPADHYAPDHGGWWQKDYNAHNRLEYRGNGGNASMRLENELDANMAKNTHVSLLQKSRRPEPTPLGFGEDELEDADVIDSGDPDGDKKE